mmetsp:Transcript_64591/g.114891  ORF Transcript_64591/g.114891 Transcript_64591/m.114891 type:complete len:164 (-) Transcript_64591:22-513(-)
MPASLHHGLSADASSLAGIDALTHCVPFCRHLNRQLASSFLCPPHAMASSQMSRPGGEVCGSHGIMSTPSSFAELADAGNATRKLQTASRFLKDITSGKVWENVKELLMTPSVRDKFQEEYRNLPRDVRQISVTVARSKQNLKEAEQYAEEVHKRLSPKETEE